MEEQHAPSEGKRSTLIETILIHGWKWAVLGLIALIVLPFVLATAHNIESGRDRDDAEERNESSGRGEDR